MAPATSHPVGKAVLVYGTVKAVAANGTERVLGPNSLIYANERIITGSDGSVSIAFNGHHEHLMLGRMSDVSVDEDVYTSTTPGQGEGETTSVEDIQTALLQDANFDPTTGLPAPAAGGGVAGAGAGPRGGGRQIVVFDADQMEVLPDSGAETRGIAFNFLDPPPSGIDVDGGDLPETTDAIITLGDVAVLEGSGTATITATVINAVTDSPLVITLDNGATITIPVGSTTGISTPFPVQSDDVYLDGESYTVAISGTVGGGFDQLDSTDTAIVTVHDTLDAVRVVLSATPSTSEDGGQITYTVSLVDGNGNAVTTQTGMTVTLANGESIDIGIGSSTGSVNVPVSRDDVYLEADSISNSISTVVETNAGTPGAFENLLADTTPVTTVITDDADAVRVVLSATPSTSEDGGQITYTVSLVDGNGNAVTTQTGMTVTLANGESINIGIGSSTGSVNVPVSRDDVYLEADSISNSISTVVETNAGTPGAFENLLADTTPVTTVITDDADAVRVVLSATPSTSEDGGQITYTVSLVDGNGNAVTTQTGMTVTLANGESIDIGIGSSTGFVNVPVSRDDVYLETDSISNSISTVVETGAGTPGAFENLLADTKPVTTVITDDADAVRVVLSATPSTSEDGGQITYTVSLVDGNGNAVTTQTGMTVTLANGESIDIGVGLSNGSVNVPISRDDVYLETDSISNSISTVVETGFGTPGAFENLLADTTPVTTVITDDADAVTATLSTTTAQISEDGGSITYTITLSGGPGAYVPTTDLSFTLQDQSVVTIHAGATSGSYTRVYTDAEITTEQAITNSIASYSGGSEYEKLVTAGETIVDVNYLPEIEPVAVHISEEGLGGADPDSTGNVDTTDTAYITGKMAATDTDGDSLSYSFSSAPAGLTSNGVAIAWSGVGSGTLVGMAGGVAILTATLAADGKYTVALAGPLDHTTQGEDTRDVVFGVDVSDGVATVATTLTVTVEDDSPVLGAFDPATLPNEPGTVSGQFTLKAGADGIDHFTITGPEIVGLDYTTDTMADGTTILHGISEIDNSEIFTVTVRTDGTYTYALVNPDAVLSEKIMTNTLDSGNSRWAETADGRIEFSASSTINSNTNGFGVGNAFVGKGEYFVMEFHNPGSTGNDPAKTNPQFLDSVTLNVSQLNGSGGTYRWNAVNLDTSITEVGYVTINGEGDYTIDPTISFTQLMITGTANIQGEGARFYSVTVSQNILPQDLSFAIQAVDNDNDVSTAQVLAIHQVEISPGQGGVVPPQYILTSTPGTDTWFASSSMVDIVTGSEHGFDVVDYSDSAAAVVVHLGENGNASGAPSDVNHPTAGTMTGGDATGDTLNGIEGIVGGQGNDVLIGNSHDNYFDGGAGADTIDGGFGADIVVYDGNDLTVKGGEGSDTLLVKGAAHIDLSETDDQSLGDTAVVTDFEHVDASGSSVSVELIGNGNANTLVGGAGNDILDGSAGNDILTGGKGADSFMASTGGDSIADYNKGEGDVVDLSNLLGDASRDNLKVGASADGHATLTVLDGDAAVGSITFETISNDGSMTLDTLLNQVDVKDSHGTI